jgi:hypothetical protein
MRIGFFILNAFSKASIKGKLSLLLKILISRNPNFWLACRISFGHFIALHSLSRFNNTSKSLFLLLYKPVLQKLRH